MTSDFRGASADAVASLAGELEAAVSGSPDTARQVADDLFQVASTLRTAGMIYVVIIGAVLFATFISVTGIADLMSQTVRDMHTSPVLAIIVMAVGVAMSALT